MPQILTTRLTNTGNLMTNGYNGYFDEVTQATISTRGNVVYTALLDEVTNSGGSSAMKHFPSGNLQVAGQFDEVTGMVVTNGLIAYIDAGKLSSFNGNGVTSGSSVPVFDLVANNNATMNGTVTWTRGGIYGESSYWRFATAGTSNFISTTLTQNYLDCTIVFQPDFTLSTSSGLVGLISSSTDATSSDKSLRLQNANGTGPWKTINPDNTDGWANSTTTYYINGVATTTSASLASGWNILGGHRTNTTNGVFAGNFAYYLGTEGYSGDLRDFQGNIAAVAFYNRQLTAAEQLNNYNYFATRYGLPTQGL